MERGDANACKWSMGMSTGRRASVRMSRYVVTPCGMDAVCHEVVLSHQGARREGPLGFGCGVEARAAAWWAVERLFSRLDLDGKPSRLAGYWILPFGVHAE